MRRLNAVVNSNAVNSQISPDCKSLSISLRPGTLRHLDSALKKQWRRYRRALSVCQKKISPSAIHQSRVNTRRLLSIVGLLSPFVARERAGRMQTMLKRYLDMFDDLRDVQVQLSAVGKMKSTFAAAGQFCDFLRRREKHFARKMRQDIKQIKSRGLGKLVAEFREDVRDWEQSDLHYAANALLLRMIHTAFARTQRLYDQIDSKDTTTIHRTRVAFKKFRYMVEIVAEDLPHMDRALLRAMHDYQTLMGNIQDAQVLLISFEKFLHKREIEPKSGRAFREHLLSHRNQLVKAYFHASGNLLRFWPTPAAPARQAQKSPTTRRSCAPAMPPSGSISRKERL